jgi:hypothetical protein
VGALYLARAFFVPLLIGILASYALRPDHRRAEGMAPFRPARAAGARRCSRPHVGRDVLGRRRRG